MTDEDDALDEPIEDAKDTPLSNPVDALRGLSAAFDGEGLSLEQHGDANAALLMNGAEMAYRVAERLLTWNNFPGRSGVKDLKVFRKNPKDLEAGLKALRVMRDLASAGFDSRVRGKMAAPLGAKSANPADETVKAIPTEEPDERTQRQREAFEKARAS